MSLKTKLISIFIILVLISSFFVAGVYAITSVSFNVEGSIKYISVVDAGTDGIYKGLQFIKIDGKEEVSVRMTSVADIDNYYPDGILVIPGHAILNGTKYPVTATKRLDQTRAGDVGSRDGAFAYTNLKSVILPKGFEHIDYYAFAGCELLTSITIPKTVTKIDGSAFAITSLTDVYYEGTEEEWNAIDIWGYGNDSLDAATKHYNHIY